jgi:hypothetical protein
MLLVKWVFINPKKLANANTWVKGHCPQFLNGLRVGKIKLIGHEVEDLV